MGSQLLGWDYKATGSEAAPIATLTTDGAGATTGNTPSGSSFETGGSVGDQANQRIVRYRGHQTWVAVQGTNIYRSTNAGSSWSSVLSDSDLGSHVCKSGLYVVEVAGTTQLVLLTRTGTSGNFAIFTSEDGSSWTKHGPYSGFTNQTMALQAGTIWRGRLYCCAGTGSSGRSYAVDLHTRTLTQATLTGLNSNFNDAALCVFDDKLYGLWHKSSSTATLYQYVPGSNTWVEKVTLGSGVANGDADRKSCLFVQGSHLYAIFCQGSGVGPIYEWKAYQIDSSLSATDVSDDTLDPVDVHAGTSPGAGARVAVIAEAGSAGGVPEIDLYFAPDATATPSATQVVVFRWNGPSTDVTELDNGSAACAAWPFGVQYSGNVFWTSGQRVIEQVSSSPVQGGTRRKFRLYSPNGSPDDVDVRAWYGSAADEYPCGASAANEAAELSDPSDGSMSGNTVTGLDAADNGSTTFEVTWNTTEQQQSLPNGDHAKLVMELTV